MYVWFIQTCAGSVVRLIKTKNREKEPRHRKHTDCRRIERDKERCREREVDRRRYEEGVRRMELGILERDSEKKGERKGGTQRKEERNR